MARNKKAILSYLRSKAEEYGRVIDYFDNKERLGEYMTNDDVYSYTIAKAKLGVVEDFVHFIELGSNIPGDVGE